FLGLVAVGHGADALSHVRERRLDVDIRTLKIARHIELIAFDKRPLAIIDAPLCVGPATCVDVALCPEDLADRRGRLVDEPLCSTVVNLIAGNDIVHLPDGRPDAEVYPIGLALLDVLELLKHCAAVGWVDLAHRRAISRTLRRAEVTERARATIECHRE